MDVALLLKVGLGVGYGIVALGTVPFPLGAIFLYDGYDGTSDAPTRSQVLSFATVPLTFAYGAVYTLASSSPSVAPLLHLVWLRASFWEGSPGQ
jgi:hypothetical protein